MSTFLRIVRFVLKALAAVVALAVTVYLVVNVTDVISAKAKRNDLSSQLTQRISEELPATQQRAETAAAGVDSAPTHRWVAQQCGFSTNDAGWIVQNYRQVCSLESVRVWKVSDEAEARALLGDRVQAGSKPSVSGACHRFEVAESLGKQDAFADTQLTLFYLAPLAQGSSWCDPTRSTFDQRRGVVGQVPDLDDTQGWLVLMQSDELVDEGIGCVHWSVLFCQNPFGDEPAWGRVTHDRADA